MEANPLQEFLDETEAPSPHRIGNYAGAIWNYLSANGLTSIIKLKSEIGCTATLIHLALGWLFRENKIEFVREKGQLLVRLK